MIDVVVDADVGGENETGEDDVFEPPQGIEAALNIACLVAGFSTQEATACIRFATDETMRTLNKQWRGKDTVTDVLSFPMQEAPFDVSEALGDIALAVPFVRQEATRLGLPVDAHIIHLIIHATLHLLGFDHIEDSDAARMQALETEAMQRMALHSPYSPEDIAMEQT